MKFIWGVVLMAVTATTAWAQSGGVDYYSAVDLQKMEQQLRQQGSLKTKGIAPEMLEKYPGHYTMLTIRAVDGRVEEHAHYADVFFIVDGEASLTTGGTVVDAETIAPGEIEGKRIEGGVTRKLAKGDVIHISPNVPHQMLIEKGKSLTYFVVKVKEE